MDDVFESIAKLLPFEKWGMKREVAEPLSIIILAAAATLFGFLAKPLYKRLRAKQKAIRAIIPPFDHASLTKYSRYYIDTYFQNASPSRQEEPGFTHQYIARSKLIPFFIKTAFNQHSETERFYVILGDSGMGKTTFLVNLYLEYHRLFQWRRRLAMKLFRFSEPDTLENVRNISKDEARDTILLLDALDEDGQIIPKDPSISEEKAFRERVDGIIAETRKFAYTIMTCRSQYFPGQEDDPYELKIRRPDEQGHYILNKLYISPFTMREVRRFLRKKYGWYFINRRKRQKAENIVRQARNLVMRPMLLNYIDYLLDGENTYPDAGAIYHEMINNWIRREAAKRKELADQQTFAENLWTLSRHLAREMYMKAKSQQGQTLAREEAMTIAAKYGITLEPREITGQSLLTCDGAGNWKFAHKSIMEYFLALELSLHPTFLKDFSFAGQDMALYFYNLMPGHFISVRMENKPEIFICPELVNSKESSISADPKVSPTRTHQWDQLEATLMEAMVYCDELNIANRYSRYYTESATRQKTSYYRLPVDQMHGFRLPTPEEFMSFSSRVRRISYPSTPHLNESGVLEDMSLHLEFAPDGVSLYNSEWCFDDRGAYVARAEKNVNEPGETFIRMVTPVPVTALGHHRSHFRIVIVP
jgi:hypothetical protein